MEQIASFFLFNSAETFCKIEMGKLLGSLTFPQILNSMRLDHLYLDGIIEFYDQFPLIFSFYQN